jgi:DNA-binding transcriptional LysR family regulator
MNAQSLVWDDIRHFLAVATAGTLSGAGASLGVDHSTVLRRIQGMEDKLGARLFDRSQRGYAPTQLAEDLLPIARRMEEEVVAFTRHASGADTTLRGKVRVTTVGDWALVCARYLHDFYEKYPRVQICTSIDERPVQLGEYQADVAIRPVTRAVHEPDAIVVEGAPLAIAMYASHGYIARHGRPRRRRDVVKHKVISALGRAAQMHTPYFGDVPEENVVYRGNNMTDLFTALQRGFGIGVTMCALGDADPGLVRLFKPDIIGSLCVLYHRDLRRNARVRAFVDHMVEYIRRDADLIGGKRVAGSS